MKSFAFISLAVFLLFFSCITSAQVRSGMVTEVLETPDEFGQRAFLTWRKGDPHAADIPRDSSWQKVDYGTYGFPEIVGSNVVPQIDFALLECFSRDEIIALGSFYRIEYGPGIHKHNYIDVHRIRLGIVFTVDREGSVVSVVFKYPDIPEYSRIRPRTWRKFEKRLRERVKWGSSSSEKKALSHYVFPYNPDWFSDLRHHLITGQPVFHHTAGDILE